MKSKECLIADRTTIIRRCHFKTNCQTRCQLPACIRGKNISKTATKLWIARELRL